jgi:hypothetical protein
LYHSFIHSKPNLIKNSIICMWPARPHRCDVPPPIQSPTCTHHVREQASSWKSVFTKGKGETKEINIYSTGRYLL